MIGGSGGVAGVPGAWYLSVPASGSKQEAAKEFIAFAYEHNDLSADTSLGLVARKSAFESKADEPGFENFPALLETLEAPQTLPRPATAQWQEIVDTVLIPMLQKAVEPGADTAQLLVRRQVPDRVDRRVDDAHQSKVPQWRSTAHRSRVGAAPDAAPTGGAGHLPRHRIRRRPASSSARTRFALA